MSNKPGTEGKGRPERKARERHHGVGRAGLSQTDRAPPTEVDGHQGVGRAGLSQSDRALPTEVESHQGVGAQGDEEPAVNKRNPLKEARERGTVAGGGSTNAHARMTVKPGAPIRVLFTSRNFV